MAEPSVDESPGHPPAVGNTTIGVTIRYFAAARAAAGMPEERIRVTTVAPGRGVSGEGVSGEGVPGPGIAGDPNTDLGIPAVRSTVGELLAAAIDRHGPGLARVLARCSFLLDEVAVHGRQTPVLDGQVLDILPPFAGG